MQSFVFFGPHRPQSFPFVPLDAQPEILPHSAPRAVTIDNIEATGPFSETSNCPSVLAAGTSYTIQVKFAPTADGAQTGSLSISDPWAGSPDVVSLSGTGTD